MLICKESSPCFSEAVGNSVNNVISFIKFAVLYDAVDKTALGFGEARATFACKIYDISFRTGSS